MLPEQVWNCFHHCSKFPYPSEQLLQDFLQEKKAFLNFMKQYDWYDKLLKWYFSTLLHLHINFKHKGFLRLFLIEDFFFVRGIIGRSSILCFVNILCQSSIYYILSIKELPFLSHFILIVHISFISNFNFIHNSTFHATIKIPFLSSSKIPLLLINCF